jgi:hypothetical protein
MKTIQASCMAALTLCLASVALADDLQTVGDSDSLGFSARRLERITSWFEAQTKKGDPSGFVVALRTTTRKFRCGRIRSFASDRCPSRLPASPP